MNSIDKGYINFQQELIRKGIHMCSLSIPIIYYHITTELAIKILLPLTLITVSIDLLRYYHEPTSKFFYKLFGFILRKHELDEKKKNLNGASWVFLSALFSVIIFPKIIFVTAFSALIICDSSAALIGRKYGKRKFLSKSLEGTLAFFVSGILVVLFTPKIYYSFEEYLIGIAAIAVGAVAENLSYGYADDNLSIPVSIGLTMYIMYIVVFPNVSFILKNAPN
jgi:dolichol kinase